MTMHWIKGWIEFECDSCRETLGTETEEFQEAVEVLRREGWTALPPLDEVHDNWRHRCPGCRFGRAA